MVNPLLRHPLSGPVGDLPVPDEPAVNLRDRFAAAALQGWIANGPTFRGEKINGTVEHADCAAEVAYVYADAMMRARKEIK